jgi:hypothetical protein
MFADEVCTSLTPPDVLNTVQCHTTANRMINKTDVLASIKSTGARRRGKVAHRIKQNILLA